MPDIRYKMRGYRLRWFGFVIPRGEDDLVRGIMGLSFEGKWGSGDPN